MPDVGGGYGKLFDSYWSGHTGRAIQAQGAGAVILGLYLPSTRHANMIGLYPLPLVYVAHDLPVLDGLENIVAALAGLADVGYAFYDHDAEMVWVVEMARVRCGLRRREPLMPRDKRHAAILRLYHEAPATPLLDRFYARYVEQLTLGDRRIVEAPSKPLRSPFEAPSKPVSSSRQQAAVRKNALRAQAQPVEKPKISTLAALLREEVIPRGIDDEGELIEAAKRAAAQRHLPYTGSAIRRALASAIAQAQKRRRA